VEEGAGVQVNFQPSPYSTSVDPSYEGPVEFFSKEARAERKEKRAEKSRDRGWERAASRSEMRAGSLRLKARGGKKLTQKSSAKKLWRDPYPWAARPDTTKQAIGYTFVGAMAYEKLSQPIAKGSRPPAMFREREWRSTILGGLQALRDAQVPDYVGLDLEGVKIPIKPSKKLDPLFLQLTGQDNLKDAAEFVRKEVRKHKLEKVAWNYRALIMIQPAVASAAVRAAGATVASAVVPMPYGLIPMAIGVQETAHSGLMAKEVEKFTANATAGLEEAGIRNSVAMAEDQARVSTALSQQETVEADAQVRKEGAALTKKIKVFTVVSLLVVASGVTFFVVRKKRAA
jgi:hypothetical protein